MILKAVGLALAMACLSQAALGQETKIAKHAAMHVAATGHASLDESLAHLVAKAALQPTAQPTQQELIGVILLMSLREQRESHI